MRLMEQSKEQGPTIRVKVGASAAQHGCEIRIDPEELASDEALARRAEIRKCQREHLEQGLGGVCLVRDCPYFFGECAEVACDWLLAHRNDEELMRELAENSSLGREPHMITSLLCSDRYWMRIARDIPALRSVAFARMRGYELVVHRDEVFRLAFETDTPVAYDGLLRMLRVTGLKVPKDLRANLKEHLIRCGAELDPWEDLLAHGDFDDDELSPAMLVACHFAGTMASMRHASWDQEEYWLLGILRLVEGAPIDLDEFAFDDEDLCNYDEDVKAVRGLLAMRGLDAKDFSSELWQALKSWQGSGFRARQLLWELVKARAEERGVAGVWARDVLEHALRSPSGAVRHALDGCHVYYRGAFR